jgi:putative transposase
MIEVDANHIHILISTSPNISAFQIIRKLKQESTVSMWKKFPIFLKKYFWKEKTFWSDGYFVATIGQVSEEMIKEYIRNQG